jgi:hypothetical protein
MNTARCCPLWVFDRPAEHSQSAQERASADEVFFGGPIQLNFLSLANYCCLLMNRLRLRTGQGFF